ncbi:MAG: anthranilate synthase component I [Pseudomonadota bacterium]|nr:anthranilate synthase component I [Pseudomonadota bacterium]
MTISSFETFENKFVQNENQVVYERIPADLDTPVSIMLKLTQAKKNSFLLESVTGGEIRGRYSIIGMDPDLIWECSGTKSRIFRDLKTKNFKEEACQGTPLNALRKLIRESKIELPEELPKMAAGLFGFLGYDMIRLVENLPLINRDTLNLPDALLLRPRSVLIIDGVKGEMNIVCPVWGQNFFAKSTEAYNDVVSRIAAINSVLSSKLKQQTVRSRMENFEYKPTSNVSKNKYLASIKKAKDYILGGDIFQVVLSQRWKIPFTLPPFSLYRALRRTNPSPYMFFFNLGKYQVIGASPEILVRVKNRTVNIRPIAGTRPRGKTTAEDKLLEKELLSDIKERSEHLMLLDLGRNDTGKVSKIGTVKPTEQFVVEKYSHVMHIVSNVEGELLDSEDALSALLSGLPAGTVSGAPKVRAMEIIDELETEKRGIYGGGIGYFGSDGEMDICIALRTGIIKDSTLYIQAGGGIVNDSKPEDEFIETVNKSKALLTAAKEAKSFVLFKD